MTLTQENKGWNDTAFAGLAPPFKAMKLRLRETKSLGIITPLVSGQLEREQALPTVEGSFFPECLCCLCRAQHISWSLNPAWKL